MGKRGKDSSVLERQETILLYDAKGQRLEFNLGGKDRHVLGRDSGCYPQIVISLEISRRHAEIIKVEGEYRIRDLESRNGTYVNGERIGNAFCPLRNRDKIRLGNNFTLIFREGLN